MSARGSAKTRDIFWMCDHRNGSGTSQLFAQEECERCARWELDPRAKRSQHAAPVFRILTRRARKRLAAVARVQHYGRHDRLYEEGAPPDFFFIVVSGLVKVFKLTPSGRRLIIELAGSGDPVGAVACYEGSQFSDSAVALQDTDCLVIPRKTLFALLKQEPSLAHVLLFSFSHRLTELMTQTTDLAARRASPRFARLLLKLCREIGHPEPRGIFIGTPLTRHELAGLTGTTVETCIRLMSRWSKQNIVRTEKGGLLVVDVSTLERLARS